MDQHTVPRFYLEVFCDPVTPEGHKPSLWVVGLREGTLKRRSPRRVATKPNYYSRTLPDGTADHGPETLLGVIESHTAPVLRKIRDGSFSLTDDERGALSFFVAF